MDIILPDDPTALAFGVLLDPDAVETNIVYFDVDGARQSAAALSAALAQRGVLINPTGSQRLRAVTNCEVSTSDIEHVIGVVAEVMVGERVLTAD